jgi:uncharacterized protein (DUF58 family)
VLTRSGALAAFGAAAAFVSGRLFGLVELYLLGAGLVILLLLAIASVVLTRLDLEVGRQLSPRRVHAGQQARVELSVVNRGDRRTPVLRLHDPVTGTQGATVLLAPVEEDLVVRSAYRLPTERRGLIGIGPLQIVVADPFGLAQVRADGAPRVELTVLPRVDDILPPPPSGGDEPLAGVRQTTLAASAGDDFAALREYVVGDDLRRVHWPSTARHGELLVRQDEVHWQGRTTVVLDTRSRAHHGESFEAAVSAAASVVSAAWKRRDLVRLATSGGWDSGFNAGQAHVERILEELAVVPATTVGSLRGVLDALPGTGATSLIVIVGDIPDPELQSLLTLPRRSGAITIVSIDRRSTPLPDHPDVVGCGAGRPFADAWNQHMTARRRRRTAVSARR